MFNSFILQEVSNAAVKKPRLDQIPTANLDADDPLDEDVNDLYLH